MMDRVFAGFRSRLIRLLSITTLVVLGASSVARAQSVTLAWDANREANLGGYTVQYGTSASSPSTSVDVGRVTTRAFSGLTAGATYYFRVVAYNTNGQSSSPSGQVSYTVPGGSGGGSTAPTFSAISPTSGPLGGGTTVTVTGTNFRSGSQVWVGGRAASTTFVSSTQLRATTPAGTAAGLTHVSVTTPSYATVTRNSAFTYTSSTSGSAPTFSSISPTSGPLAGGTTVTVTGTNFRTGSQIWVGGRSVSTTYVSSTQLRARTPAGTAAGATHVSVTTPDFPTVTRTGAFTYTGTASSSSPNISGVSPTSGPLAGGTTITITGSGFVSGATVRLASRAATSVTFVSSTQIRARTPAGWQAGGVIVVVTNPNGNTASRNNGFWYSGSSSATAADTTLAASSSVRLLAADPSAAGAETRLALTNADAAPASATLTFTDAQGTATPVNVEVPARQRLTLDARSTPALRGPVSVALDASEGVALERLTVAADQGAATLTPAAQAAATWEFAAGTTVAPNTLAYIIENPGATEASVDARFLRANGAEPVSARYAVPAGGRLVVDVAQVDPSLAGSAVAAEFAASDDARVVVTRLAASGGGSASRVGDTSAGATSAAATWRVAGDTAGTALALAIANPGTEAALVEARYTTTAGATVTKRYDVAAQSLLTVDVPAEDASLRNTTVDVQLESMNGAPVVVERSQWWRAADGSSDGLAGAGAADPAARWLFAEGEEGGADQALTTLRVTNTSAQAVEARVTVLFENADESTGVVTVGAGESVASALTKIVPQAAGRRFSILVESADGSPSLLVERRLFQRTADGRVMGSASSGSAVK